MKNQSQYHEMGFRYIYKEVSLRWKDLCW